MLPTHPAQWSWFVRRFRAGGCHAASAQVVPPTTKTPNYCALCLQSIPRSAHFQGRPLFRSESFACRLRRRQRPRPLPSDVVVARWAYGCASRLCSLCLGLANRTRHDGAGSTPYSERPADPSFSAPHQAPAHSISILEYRPVLDGLVQHTFPSPGAFGIPHPSASHALTDENFIVNVRAIFFFSHRAKHLAKNQAPGCRQTTRMLEAGWKPRRARWRLPLQSHSGKK